ncbi:hypothetical protein [Shinella pollutisoli]|uniref:Phage holin n=1 Tax=Shinella pollutisoli TaxID=2250594 RepID=A0ABV7DJ12_9HYPH|nr:hypothetical protein [Shinella pollutisoli]
MKLELATIIQSTLDALGLNGSVLVAGGAGGVLRALSSRRHTLRERIVSPICGAIAAGYLTSFAVHALYKTALPLPEDPAVTIGTVGFLIGACAMWISDALMLIAMRWIKSGG